jgi:hypothetical protein
MAVRKDWRWGAIAVLVLGLVGCSATPEPYRDASFGGARDLLARLRALGQEDMAAHPEVLQHTLGLTSELADRGVRGVLSGDMAGPSPAYLRGRQAHFDLRRSGPEPTAGGVAGVPSASLSLEIDPERVCLSVSDIQQVFRGRVEVFSVIGTDGFYDEYLSALTQESPPLSISFSSHIYSGNCWNTVHIRRNCFNAWGPGCSVHLRVRHPYNPALEAIVQNPR